MKYKQKNQLEKLNELKINEQNQNGAILQKYKIENRNKKRIKL